MPTGVDLPTLLGHLQNFLAQNGYPVRPSVLGSGSDAPAGAMGWAAPGEVDFTPAYTAQLGQVAGRYGQRGRLTPKQVTALSAAMHEQLHQMRYGRTPELYNDPRAAYWEEAATQAATEDLLPIALVKLFGHRMSPRTGNSAMDQSPVYPERVKLLRDFSTAATSSPTYNAYGARVWRRRFSHADVAGRKTMLAQARAAVRRQRAKPVSKRPAPPDGLGVPDQPVLR